VRRLLWLLAAAAAGTWLAARAAGAFRVEVAGTSMVPALRPGDWLVATRAGRIRSGRVVVLAHPSRDLDLVKRVAGVPGDVVHGYRLGPGEFLVVGDNLPRSSDGRDFGSVSREAIEGVARFRYWPHPGPVRRGPARLSPGS
jgi:signal peptidase I